jgi:hypothetical protein
MIDKKFTALAGVNPPQPEKGILLDAPLANASPGSISKFLEWFGDLGIFFWRVARRCNAAV